MRALAQHVEDEQRRAWDDYAARLRDLDGPEYDAAEADAWEELQATLRVLGLPAAPADHDSV